MAMGETNSCLTCESCGAKLSWPVVRGLTAKREGRSAALYCPACRSPMDQVDVRAIHP
ncbi:hypothetical protein SAMN04487948_102179 [Halogranum amylolyticum]|uniref:Uncharacterized protein n=1 Tax=Halogranum amylolyticum TaxID=660520 RepID=A0A1H8PB40_9EURY|nr:hypothetical protein SAMN04487948_102179 [Halogranum amylolyticum]